ncbi:MAG: hypothetical protein EBE86_012710 [Hormoscilla sp. GUM202]|nr:hypothetical protein [Hormoscilla sp. GM7CHS1pb]MBO1348187.1 hypothetical protein [Hormoscilla sp. GUM202]
MKLKKIERNKYHRPEQNNVVFGDRPNTSLGLASGRSGPNRKLSAIIGTPILVRSAMGFDKRSVGYSLLMPIQEYHSFAECIGDDIIMTNRMENGFAARS